MNSLEIKSRVTIYLTNGKYDPRKSEIRKREIQQTMRKTLFIKSLRGEIHSLCGLFKQLG